jgi:hypothetical protein
MDLLLIAITIGALAVALGASVVAWRAAREEKVRAAARVAALSVAAGVPPLQSAAPEATTRVLQPGPGDEISPLGGLSKTASASAPTARELQASSSEAGAPGVVLPGQFLGADASPRENGGRQRWLAAAAAVFAVLLGGFVISRVAGTSAAATARQAAPPAPLELLSLGHQREGNNLSVTGLVRNPAAGTAVARVTAVVFLFDQQGTFVSSAKAPLDYVTLSGGDESPFVIKVQAPPSVARYRVSFRTDEGTLPHVDRRGEPAVTTPVALTRQ